MSFFGRAQGLPWYQLARARSVYYNTLHNLLDESFERGLQGWLADEGLREERLEDRPREAAVSPGVSSLLPQLAMVFTNAFSPFQCALVRPSRGAVCRPCQPSRHGEAPHSALIFRWMGWGHSTTYRDRRRGET